MPNPRSTYASTRRHDIAFTLVEMLLVVAIIALLISILLPSLSRARFNAKTAICLSNQHQRAAALMFGATDNKSRFHNFNIPRGIGLNPWGVGSAFLPTMATYGMTVQFWFCPVIPTGKMWAQDPLFVASPYNIPDALLATNDPVAINNQMSSHYSGLAITQLTYWVPTAATNGLTPHNGTGPARNVWGKSEWPTRLSDAGSRQGPIIGDVLYVHPIIGALNDRSLIQGGHKHGNQIESAGFAWPDGSAQLRNHAAFQLAQDQHYGVWY